MEGCKSDLFGGWVYYLAKSLLDNVLLLFAAGLSKHHCHTVTSRRKGTQNKETSLGHPSPDLLSIVLCGRFPSRMFCLGMANNFS